MTRRFSEEWDSSTAGRDPRDPAEDTTIAPQHVQDRVTALLRDASHEEVAMPTDVEERLRGALAAQFGRAAGGPVETSAGAATVAVPLRPLRVSDEITRPAASSASNTSTRASAGTERVGAERRPDTGASVVSLDAHRSRSRRIRTAALALGAAAAVAIGATTAVQMNKGDDAPVAAEHAASGTTTNGQSYASRVRVTQSGTTYEAASFAAQARALPASTATPIEPVQANAQSLGPLATGEGVQSCLDAVAKGIASMPDKVYADFATYDGAPAVIVVTEKGSTRTAWVVSRTCRSASDLKAGPTALQT